MKRGAWWPSITSQPPCTNAGWQFTLTAAAYNLIRLPKLLPA